MVVLTEIILQYERLNSYEYNQERLDKIDGY
jgi:hypothetical protein